MSNKHMPGRCNYCEQPSVVSFRYRFTYSKMGHQRIGFVTVQACVGHEGCTNWDGMRALHPDAPILRAATDPATEDARRAYGDDLARGSREDARSAK